MRIIHVVTLVSPDGAFGGPLRVALNQCRALLDRGHEVQLAAAVRGHDPVPDELDGIPFTGFEAVHRLPRAGFATMRAPGLADWVGRRAAATDVVHVHLARDLVTLPVARRLEREGRWVAQTHGMIDASDRWSARVVDRVATRRALHDADAVLHLTPAERADLEAVAGSGLRVRELPNGVPIDPVLDLPTDDDVLFLARLAPRKRPELFAAAAAMLAPQNPGWTFSVVGPDEGAEAPARAAAQGHLSIRFEGSLPPGLTAARLRRAAVYVLPAVDEPFGMSVVEAMAQRRPVVVTRSCGLSGAIDAAGAGIVVDDDSVPSLVGAVERLMADPGLRERMGAAGRELVQREFSMDAVTDRLLDVYAEVTG